MDLLRDLTGFEELSPELLLILALPIGLIILMFALFGGGEQRRQLGRRVTRVKEHHDKKPMTTEQVLIARRSTRSSDIRALDQFIRRYIPRQEMLRLRLSRAGLELSISIYLLASALLGVIATVAATAVWNLPFAASAPLGLLCALALPHMFVSMRIKRRQLKFIEFFPDAIDLMVRGIKAGLPITESMKTAGEEVPDPVGIELKKITDSIRIGRKMEEVLWETSRRIDLQEFNFFTIALSIQSETGGNLAETLNNLSEVLRGRRQLKRKIKALSSEAKASAYIIGSLPFVMTLLIYLVNREYIMGLFLDPRGQFMIGFGLFMIASGAAVMYRMVKFEI